MIHNVVLQDTSCDTWRWLLDPIHGYTVRGTYHFLTSPGAGVDRPHVDEVWHTCIPSKVSLFVWRLLRDRLPTKNNLLRRGVIQATDTDCTTGCGELETVTHLFLGCDTYGSLWSYVLHWLGISSVLHGDLRHHFVQFTHQAGLPRSSYLYLRLIWFASVWVIWKERNNRVFNNVALGVEVLLEKVKLNSFLWLKSKQVVFPYSYHEWWKHPLCCMGIC
jgi:hypothetical protein